MKRLSLAIVALSLVFASCDKKKTDPPANNPTSPAPAPQPPVKSGNGGLIAVKTIINTTVQGFPVNTEMGLGVAVLGDMAAKNYVDAGAVTLQSQALTFNANNTYAYTPSQANPTGLDFSNNIKWTIEGKNNIPAVSYDAKTGAGARGMPNVGDMNDFTTVNSANDFTISLSSVSNADTVYYQFSGTNGTVVLKTLPGNTNSATFTAAELQSLGKGMGTVTIAPWNVVSQTISGYKFFFVNEVAVSRLVDIQ